MRRKLTYEAEPRSRVALDLWSLEQIINDAKKLGISGSIAPLITLKPQPDPYGGNIKKVEITG